MTTAIDPNVLAAVASVQVFAISDCSTLADLAVLDAGAAAAIAASPQVAASLQAAGEFGAEIVGYALDGTSLTVYVRHKA